MTPADAAGSYDDKSLLDRMQTEWPIYALAAGCVLVFYMLLLIKNVPFGLGNIVLNIQVYIAAAAVMLSIDVIRLLFVERPQSPLMALRQRYVRSGRYRSWQAGLPMLIAVAVFMALFSRMKAMIPLMNDYTWDATFIAWDRWLLFGRDAWQVMQPVLGYPVVTSILSVFYNCWLLLLYVGCIYFAAFPVDAFVRRTFFLTFILSWTLIGVLLATWLASVGPYFLETMIGDPHFSAQTAYLHSAGRHYPILSLPVQEQLLDWYRNKSAGLGRGITAMPSMHVSIAFLFYLAMRRISRKAGLAFLAFLIVIVIGSVHLAYHYLVDAVVAIIATAILWKVSHMLVGRFDRMRDSGQIDRAGTEAVS